MIRKTILITLFFAFAFVFKSASAEAALAAEVQGWLDNRSGSVPVTVTVTIKNNSGAIVDTFTQAVAAGTSVFYSRSNITTGNYPSVSWFTSCDFGAEATTGGLAIYSFPNQTVRCSTTNSTLTTTKTSCVSNEGRIEWKVNTNPVPNQTPNISTVKSFRIYKSLNSDPLADTAPITKAYSPGTVDYAENIPGLGTGSWNLAVRAYTNDPDNNSTVTYGNLACGIDIVSPTNLNANVVVLSTNLNANVGCSGFSVKVDFGWYGENLTYTVEYGSTGSGSWSNLSQNGLTQTYYSHIDSPLNMNTTYDWRIKGYHASTASFYTSPQSSFTTGVCPLTTVVPPNVDNFPAVTCTANSEDNDNDPYNDYGSATSADPTKVKIQWVRATGGAIDEERVDWGPDPSFASGTYQTATNPFGGSGAQKFYIITNGVSANTLYYYRVSAKIDGKVHSSKIRTFKGVSQCNSASVAFTSAYSYCYNNQTRWRVTWSKPVASTTYTLKNDYLLDTNRDWQTLPNTSQNPTKAYFWEGVTNLPKSEQIEFTLDGGATLTGSVPTSLCQAVTPPSAPKIVTLGCVNNKPTVRFEFIDQSNNEDQFWLEVSDKPFTGATATTTTNVWGTRKIISAGTSWNELGITGSYPEQVLTNRSVQYDWQDPPNDPDYQYTYGNIGLGDANSVDTTLANNLIPLNGTTYYWRVKAIMRENQSNAARGANYDTPYIYPDGTLTGSIYPTGLSFTTKNCSLGYDLAVSIVPGSWKNGISVTSVNVDNGGTYATVPTVSFSGGGGTGATATAQVSGGTIISISIDTGGTGYTSAPTVSFSGGGGTGATATAQVSGGIQTQSFLAGEIVSVDVKITNNLGSQTTSSPPTLMYFYYRGTEQGTSPSVDAPPACPIDPRFFPPTLGSVTPQPSNVPPISPGGSVTQNVKFTVDSAASFGVASAYVVPRCDFGALGTESNFSNNSASFTYSVSVKGFFASTSGDVGAKGKISVGVNSSLILPTPKFQSRNMLVAEQLSTNANVPIIAPVGFRIENYKNELVSKGGVYDYFSRRYKANAVSNDLEKRGCAISTDSYNSLANSFYHCNNSVTISSSTAITGTPVFFIDGDLNINANVTLANATSGAVFIVSGDIYVKAGVISINGIFIARKSFYNCTASECGVFYASGKLTVVGGIYADGEDGTPGILLQRFLTAGGNSANELALFTFDPRYYFLYTNILTYAPVGWRETAP